MLKLHFALILSLFLFACVSKPKQQLLGSWQFIEIGEDFKDTKFCTFESVGGFTCTIHEIGFSGGLGEAVTYKMTGSWLLDGDSLKLSFSRSYSPEKKEKSVYLVVQSKRSLMTLKSSNGNLEEWHREGGL
ncbi:hypothetical protein [Alteromonas flava]|uniref:hypothetical protein n=1 Tax=Alteromonas flava TaxID=2048003 RepID=UPI000C28C0EB|nr:hypothetical protein [Alteromonas flava]